MNMVNEKTWEEFRDSGLLWWVNMILHTFGWAIVVNIDDFDGEEVVIDAFPARVKFRGFSEQSNTNGYIKVTERLAKDIEILCNETKDEFTKEKEKK